MPNPMIESFNKKKTGLTGIEHEYKEREEEKMRRARRKEVAKSVQDEFCATLEHRSEAMRKDLEQLTREAMYSMKNRYEEDISSLREGQET